MNNIYYDPEKSGLRIVAEVDKGASYEFDKFVVWERLSDGTRWFATDAGDSRPDPFESLGVGDLEPVGESFTARVVAWRDEVPYSTPDVSALLAAARRPR